METVDLSNEELPQQIENFYVDHVEEIFTAFQQLKKKCWRLVLGQFRSKISKDTVRFYELYESNITSVKLSIERIYDFIPRVHVHNKLIQNDHDNMRYAQTKIFLDITPLCSGITHQQSLEITALRESDIGGTVLHISDIPQQKDLLIVNFA